MHPKKGSPFKKFSQIIRRRAAFKGGIEQIQPNMISGWVFCNGQKLDFVELVYGNKSKNYRVLWTKTFKR